MNRRNSVLVVALLNILFPVELRGEIFVDEFNRTNGVPDNDWVEIPISGSLEIFDNELVVATPNVGGAIYRKWDAGSSTRVQADISPTVDGQNAGDRFGHTFFLNNGPGNNNGYGVSLSRTSNRFTNSSLSVFGPSGDIETFVPDFQWSGDLAVDFTLDTNSSSIIGSITNQTSQVFDFNVNTGAIAQPLDHFGLQLGGPGSTSSVLPSFDKVRLESEGVVPEPLTPRLFGMVIGTNSSFLVRGDKDADAIYDVLSSDPRWAPASAGNPQSPFYATDVNEIRNTLDGMDIRPDDSFIFYFSGHGGPASEFGGDEDEVILDSVAASNLGYSTTSNKQDEALALNRSKSEKILDDELAEMFLADKQKWSKARKLFFLDACFTGGFFGSVDPDAPPFGAEGDLSRLDNVAIFAAASESSTTSPTKSPFNLGRGIWTLEVIEGALERALRNELTIEEINSLVTDAEVRLNSTYGGQLLPLKDFFGENDEAVFSYEPMTFFSQDFQANIGVLVPEPSSATVLIAFVMSLATMREKYLR